MARDKNELYKKAAGLVQQKKGVSSGKFAQRTGLDDKKSESSAGSKKRDKAVLYERASGLLQKRNAGKEEEDAGNDKKGRFSEFERRIDTKPSATDSTAFSAANDRGTDEEYFDYLRRMRNTVYGQNAPARTGAVFGTDIDTGNVKSAKDPLDSLPDMDSRYLDGMRQMLRQSEDLQPAERGYSYTYSPDYAGSVREGQDRLRGLETARELYKLNKSMSPGRNGVSLGDEDREDMIAEYDALYKETGIEAYKDTADRLRSGEDIGLVDIYDGTSAAAEPELFTGDPWLARNAKEIRETQDVIDRRRDANTSARLDESYFRTNEERWAAAGAEMEASGYIYDPDAEALADAADVKATPGRDVLKRMDDVLGGEHLSEYWTSEEKALYDWLVSEGRTEDADDYAEYLSYAAYDRRNQGTRAAVEDAYNGTDGQDSGLVNKVVLGAMPMTDGLPKLINTIDIIGQDLFNGLGVSEYRPINYKRTSLYGEVSGDAQGYVTEELNNIGTVNDLTKLVFGEDFNLADYGIAHGSLGNKGLGTIYSTGVDLVRSYVNSKLFPFKGGGLVSMSAQSASDAYAQAIEQGASPQEALSFMLPYGSAEALGEMTPFSIFSGYLGNVGVKGKGLKTVLLFGLDVLGDGVGEAATSYMQQAAEDAILGEHSQYAIRVNKYAGALMQYGYNPADARAMAMEMVSDEKTTELWDSWWMGMLGAAGTATISTPAASLYNRYVRYADTVDIGKRINSLGNREALQQMFSEATGSEVQMPKSNAGVGRTVNKQMRQLQQANDAERDAAVLDYYDRMKGTYAEGATEQDIAAARKNSPELKAVRDALLRSAQGRKVSVKQQQLLAVDDAAKATIEAYNKGDIKMSDAAVKRAETMEYAQAATVIPDIKGKMAAMSNSGTTDDIRRRASEVGGRMTVDENAAGSSVNGEDIREVNGIKQVAKGDQDAVVTVTMADGSARDAKLDEVTFGGNVDAEVYQYAAVMATPELANQFRMAVISENVAMDQLANGMNNAYDMGLSGFRNIATVQNSALTAGLSADIVKTAFDMGVANRAKTIEGRIDKAAQRFAKYTGREWRPGSVKTTGIDMTSLTDIQRKNIEQVEMVAKLLGINVELFESKANNEGKFEDENGSYNAATNTIRLDINAGRNAASDSMANTAMLRTMSHELTHAIQRNTPKQYEALRDAVLDVLEAQDGYSLEERVDKRLADAAATAKKSGKQPSITTRDQAIDEVIADACEMMLRDSDAIQRLRDAHPDAAKSFGEKVMEFIDKLLNAIREIFGKENTAESKALAKAMESDLQRIRDMWSEALVETAEVSGRENTGMGAETAEDVMAAGAKNPANEAAEGDAVGMYGEPARPKEAHIDQRIWAEMGDGKVDAFLNDYMYARIYMPPAASVLQSDLQNGIKGERFMTPDGEWNGQKRMTTQIIADALDNGMTWDGLQKALEIIVNAPNTVNEAHEPVVIRSNAAVKRVELMLDDMLSHGYKDSMGTVFAPDAEYIEYKNSLPGAIAEATPEAAEGSIQFSDVQFEMRDTVEYRKNLVAVHNRSESSLLMNIELGGFPMPSVAIVKADQGHNKFGEISVVLNRAAVDPLTDKRNRVYGADAWTVTFPRVRYEVDDRKFNTLYSDLNALSRDIPDFLRSEMLSFTNIMYDGVSDLSAEEIFERARDNVAVQAAYLVDMHDDFEVQKKQVQNDPGFNEDRSDRYERFIREYDGDIGQIMKRPLKELYEANKELFDSIEADIAREYHKVE